MNEEVCPRLFHIDNKDDHFISLRSVVFVGKTEDSFKDENGNYHNHARNYVQRVYECVCGERIENIEVNSCPCGWVNTL